MKVRQDGRVGLEAAQAVVAVNVLDVETAQTLCDGLPGLRGRADHRDARAVFETVEHVGKHEIRGRTTDVVPCGPQAHLKECSVEPDGAHARQGWEVRVQEGPMVQP